MNSINLPIFILMTVVFIGVTMYIGWYGYKSSKNSEDYMLGRNKTSPFIIAMSYGATFLSASAVIGFGGQAAVHGASLIWLCFLNLAVGVFVSFAFFGKRTRRIGKRLKASTFADLMGKMFGSRGIRTYTALLIIVMMPVYCAAVLKGGVNSLAVITGLDYNMMLLILSVIVAVYVVYGGIIAVMYNDALQAMIMLVGMIVIFAVTIGAVGWDGFSKLTEYTISGVVQKGTLPGATGWTSFAEFGSPEWMTVVTTFLLGVGIGSVTQPQLAVRFMSAKDDKTLDRSMHIGAAFIFIIVGVAYTVGTLSNVYFYENYGVTAFDYVTSGVDFIIPTYIMDVFSSITFGDVFVSLFLLSLLCASISTISALMHTIGAAGGYDINSVWNSRKLGKDVDKPSVRLNGQVTSLMMVLVVVYCYLMPSDIIAKATSVFMGITGASLLPAYAYGLYSKKPWKKPAIYSIATGSVVYMIWALFVCSSTSIFLPICNAITGNKVLFSGVIQYVDPMVVALPISAIVMAVSLLIYRHRSEAVSPSIA